MSCMGWVGLGLDAEVRPVIRDSRAEYVEDRDLEGDEGGEGRVPVRKRSERAVKRPSHHMGVWAS